MARYTDSVTRLWNFVGWLEPWTALVRSRFVTVLYHSSAWCWLSAASRAASTYLKSSSSLIVLSMSPHRSPSLPPVGLPSMLATSLSSGPTSIPRPKTICRHCVSRALIGPFCGTYLSTPSTLMCLHHSERLAFLILSPRRRVSCLLHHYRPPRHLHGLHWLF